MLKSLVIRVLSETFNKKMSFLFFYYPLADCHLIRSISPIFYGQLKRSKILKLQKMIVKSSMSFVLFESACPIAAHKHVGEIETS